MNELMKRFSHIKTDYNLADLTTLKIGGNAKYFLLSKDIEEIKSIINFCSNNGIKFRIIGGGSNSLVSDKGYDGLIIKFDSKDIIVNGNMFIVGAGVVLANFIDFSLKNGSIGQAFLAGIPGTIGGAIYGNAGAYGQDMSNIVDSVKVLNDKYEIQEIPNIECSFSYRESIFSSKKCVIFEVKIILEKGDIKESKEIIKQRIQDRVSNHPLEYPNAGSWFKNIFLDNKIRKKLQDLDISRFEEHKKIPAAFLIEQAGLKGLNIGDAEVSKKHANFLINKGNASAEDVIKLSNLVKEKIKDKYDIELHEEVQYIGF